MSQIQNMFNNQRKPTIHTQNVMLQNKQRNVQKFSAFDNKVFDLVNKSSGSSYNEICERLAYDPRQTIEKQFRQDFVNYMKIVSLAICDKINISNIRDAQTAVTAITEAMNEGGFETGMLSLTPWILECAKSYCEIERRKHPKDLNWSDVIETCDNLKSAFGEGISMLSVAACIGSCMTYSQNLYNQLMSQASLIRTACTYHVAGKIEMGSRMSYEDALNIFVNCICNSPQSFKLYGTFIKMFQNTQQHAIYYIGAQLASDGIKYVRNMKRSGRNKTFEAQLDDIGGATSFSEMFNEINRKEHCVNAAYGIADKFGGRGNMDINELIRGFNGNGNFF